MDRGSRPVVAPESTSSSRFLQFCFCHRKFAIADPGHHNYRAFLGVRLHAFEVSGWKGHSQTVKGNNYLH